MIAESKRAQSVYVAADKNGRHKIGISGSPKERERKLSWEIGSPVSIVHFGAPACKAPIIEATAHWLLEGLRDTGEWFTVDKTTALAALERATEMVGLGHSPERRLCSTGRPPLHLKPVPVRFAPTTLERVDKIAGSYGRPKFIREAVEEKLAREENAQ